MYLYICVYDIIWIIYTTCAKILLWHFYKCVKRSLIICTAQISFCLLSLLPLISILFLNSLLPLPCLILIYPHFLHPFIKWGAAILSPWHVIGNSSGISMCMCLCCWISSDRCPGMLQLSCVYSIFNFSEKLHTEYHSAWTKRHSREHCTLINTECFLRFLSMY